MGSLELPGSLSAKARASMPTQRLNDKQCWHLQEMENFFRKLVELSSLGSVKGACV
jgi:hypothetical protein